ncbi:glycosyltransferase [Pelagibacteraceae bacterium]|nr:glycosyltransferase [Pelagibacteraceae bacterium]
MKKLFIITNESIFNYEEEFFCDNIDLKSTPEGLNNTFEVNIIGRKSKQVRSHKINVNKIKVLGGIFSYLIEILRSFADKNSKYLIISISPFTFFACILINIFKKKNIVYLRSDGYGEYRTILGFFGPFIYHLMFSIVSKISPLLSCRKNILKGNKGDVVFPSQITSKWLSNHKEIDTNQVKLLYVGRVKKEKGIYSLLDIINDSNSNLQLSIVGAEKKFLDQIVQKNVSVHEIEVNEQNLIKIYDNHNIFVLPSFTEGHPMALLEALSRLRPVIIFKDIEHVIEDKKGIFLAERNYTSFLKVIYHIKDNYKKIQDEMKGNKIPTKEQFLKSMKEVISKTI